MVTAAQILPNASLQDRIRHHGLCASVEHQGPLLLDSGGFSLLARPDLPVTEVGLQQLTAVARPDLRVPLDYPLDPRADPKENRDRWRRTLINTASAFAAEDGTPVMPVVHGYSMTALGNACDAVQDLGRPVRFVAVGSLVPLFRGFSGRLELHKPTTGSRVSPPLAYALKAISFVRRRFPNAMLHVLGVGAVSTMMLAFAAGADSVDSMGWQIRAAYGAIQLPGSTDRSPLPTMKRRRRQIDQIDAGVLASCLCPVCSQDNRHSAAARQKLLGSSFQNRAIHNAWVTASEVHALRTAIVEGHFDDFLETRLSVTRKHANALLYIRSLYHTR